MADFGLGMDDARENRFRLLFGVTELFGDVDKLLSQGHFINRLRRKSLQFRSNFLFGDGCYRLFLLQKSNVIVVSKCLYANAEQLLSCCAHSTFSGFCASFTPFRTRRLLSRETHRKMAMAIPRIIIVDTATM